MQNMIKQHSVWVLKHLLFASRNRPTTETGHKQQQNTLKLVVGEEKPERIQGWKLRLCWFSPRQESALYIIWPLLSGLLLSGELVCLNNCTSQKKNYVELWSSGPQKDQPVHYIFLTARYYGLSVCFLHNFMYKPVGLDWTEMVSVVITDCPQPSPDILHWVNADSNWNTRCSSAFLIKHKELKVCPDLTPSLAAEARQANKGTIHIKGVKTGNTHVTHHFSKLLTLAQPSQSQSATLTLRQASQERLPPLRSVSRQVREETRPNICVHLCPAHVLLHRYKCFII